MVNFTSNTYQMKREILNFSAKISRNLTKPEKKFTADRLMVYSPLKVVFLLTLLTNFMKEHKK